MTRRGRVPYKPKKAPPFTLQQLLRMHTYCLKTIEVRIYGLVVWLQVVLVNIANFHEMFCKY